MSSPGMLATVPSVANYLFECSLVNTVASRVWTSPVTFIWDTIVSSSSAVSYNTSTGVFTLNQTGTYDFRLNTQFDAPYTTGVGLQGQIILNGTPWCTFFNGALINGFVTSAGTQVSLNCPAYFMIPVDGVNASPGATFIVQFTCTNTALTFGTNGSSAGNPNATLSQIIYYAG